MTSIFTPRPVGLRLVEGAGPEAIPRTEPCDPLPGLWDFARLVHDEICLLWGEPAELAMKFRIHRQEHHRLGDWLRNLELLVRRLLLIAALSFDPGPLRPHAQRRPRESRYILIWPHKPEEWHARFKMFPKQHGGHRGARRKRDPDAHPRPLVESWPIAKRIEALRLLLANPDKRARRVALRLARIRAANAKANEPRLLALRPWDFAPDKRTLGKHAVNDGMKVAQPLAEEALDRWQEPG